MESSNTNHIGSKLKNLKGYQSIISFALLIGGIYFTLFPYMDASEESRWSLFTGLGLIGTALLFFLGVYINNWVHRRGNKQITR